MSRYRMVTGWIAVVGLALPGLALAQLSAIGGTVRSEYGELLPGVQVVASSDALGEGAGDEEGLGATRTAVTNERGVYSLNRLPPGWYTLTFALEGFSSVRLQEIRLSAGSARRVDIELEIATLAEQILTAGGETGPFRIEKCSDLLAPGIGVLYRPICRLGQAAYVFNTPPGLRYLEEEDLLFRVDPTSTALEAKEDVAALGLRGAVEALTGPWSRCMAAELVETTIDSKLRAVPINRPKLKIQPLIQKLDDPEQWEARDSDAQPVVRHMGLHPTDWRWRITGIRPGRTQLALRLYAVAVLGGEENLPDGTTVPISPPGKPKCADADSRWPDGSRRRVRTLQRRLAIEVSATQWVDTRLPPPLLWSLLLPPAGLALAWWRRRRGRPALASGEKD